MPKSSYEKVVGDDRKDGETNNSHPLESANFLSILTFWWMNNTLRTGFKRPLERDDFLPLCADDNTQTLTEKLRNLWNNTLKECDKKGKTPKLWKCVAKFISFREACVVWSIWLLETLCRVLQPWLLEILVSLLMQPELEARGLAYACAVLIGLVALVGACTHVANFKCELMGMRLSSAIRGVVYLKIPLISKQSLQQVSVGHVIDLISNDVQRMELAPRWVLGSFLLIVELPVVVCSMLYLVGWQSLMGVVLLVVLVPYTMKLSLLCAKLREQTATVTDQRVSLMDELVSGIRAIKANTWEDNYRDMIADVRRGEIFTILKKFAVLSAVECLPHTVGSVATFLSVFTLVFTGHSITPVNAFVLVSFMNILRRTMLIKLAGTIQIVSELYVSLKRLEKFLLVENLPSLEQDQGERPTNKANKNQSLTFIKEPSPRGNTTAGKDVIKKEPGKDVIGDERALHSTVSVSDLTAKVDKPVKKYLLQNVSFQASHKSLNVLTGQIGSGKSTLLSLIARENLPSSGSIAYPGTLAYVSQVAWIFSGTLRENILFGNPYIESNYVRVIDACALTEDLERFPSGDMTFVGERGVVLSGGQRARVSLARAVYADADVYLMDDPLSAVDVKVGDHIFQQCICQLLRDKTRILVTYSEKHMKTADQVVVLYKGSVLGKGSFSDLYRDSILDTILDSANRENKENPSRKSTATRVKAASSNRNEADTYTDPDMQMSEEDRATGNISCRLYWDYLRAGTVAPAIFALAVFFAVSQAGLIASDMWLSLITKMSSEDQQNLTILAIYAGLVTAGFVLAIVRTFLFYYLCLRSSGSLHDRVADRLLHTQVLFFDTNPAGRILNRLSKDVGLVDEMLPKALLATIQYLLVMLSGLLVPSITSFWIIFALVPVIVIFVLLSWYYLKSSRELQRLESIYRSPVFSHFSETMSGLDTIRTRRMEKEFINRFYRHQNDNNQAFSMVLACGRWLCVRADILFAIFSGLVAVAAVLFSQDPALAGLAIAYVIETAMFSHYAVRQYSLSENSMTSVERIMTYANLDIEPGYKLDALPTQVWPCDGGVKFENVSLRYYSGGPQVLKNLSFDIQGGARIGIVGRTGDGKSSIVAALLRMPEAEGNILIDGVSVSEVNLKQSRQCFTVLSQTPFLFTGSLRKNLDPLGKYQDADLWNVLENTQLKPLVENLEGKLDYELCERGANFSVGERQLICLARTLLRRSKIVILDEPTAHVDPGTEQTIWEIVNDKLKDTTLITVAHRLNTIRDCDHILVMRNGEVAECGSFESLLAQEGGIFHDMAVSQAL